MKYLSFIILIILGSCNSDPVENSNDSNPSPTNFSEKAIVQEEVIELNQSVKCGEKFSHTTSHEMGDTLILKSLTDYYEITPEGKVSINEQYRFQLQTELIIDKAYLYQDSLYWYMFFEETDFDISQSWLQKIRKKDLHNQYLLKIYGFNLGQPIIIDSLTYVTGIGFVGQINLNNGKYNWKIENLYDREKASFNSFDTIIIKKDIVEFHSEHYRTKNIDKVIVERENGKIIELIK